MKRWRFPLIYLGLLLAFVGLLVAVSGPALAGGGGPPEMARKIVVLSPDVVNEVAEEQIARLGGIISKSIATSRGTLLVVYLPEPASRAVAQLPGVLRVEDDVVVWALDKPPWAGKPKPTPEPPPSEILPWGVNRIDAELVWPGSNTGAGVTVAVIDTGIDKDHPDLEANIVGGRNFVGKGPSWRRKVDPEKWDDDNGHGTHVAGTVAAIDNEEGVIGVAPGASLLGVKVLDQNGGGYLSDIVDGIYWAVDIGPDGEEASGDEADVINMSLGTTYNVQTFRDAVDYAEGQGVVVVASAGNEGSGTDTVLYPAKYGSVIAVAATWSNDERASFSSTGPSVELAAPGVYVYSTYKDGQYGTLSGTSMASPHVAGTAALVIASGVTDNNEVRGLLVSTADDLGIDDCDPLFGYGLVDAEEAATGAETPETPS